VVRRTKTCGAWHFKQHSRVSAGKSFSDECTACLREGVACAVSCHPSAAATLVDSITNPMTLITAVKVPLAVVVSLYQNTCQKDGDVFRLFDRVRNGKAEDLEALRTSAAGSSALAQAYVALCMHMGYGICDVVNSKETEQTVKSLDLRALTELAEKGSLHAQALLGILMYYQATLASGSDYNDAVKWVRQASDAGLPEAQYWLGRWLSLKAGLGEVLSQDLAEAKRLLTCAAESGLVIAMYALGALLWRHPKNVQIAGSPRNRPIRAQELLNIQTLAHRWMLFACLKGYHGGCRELMEAYKLGRYGFPRDEIRAASVIQLAEEFGYTHAMWEANRAWAEALLAEAEDDGALPEEDFLQKDALEMGLRVSDGAVALLAATAGVSISNHNASAGNVTGGSAPSTPTAPSTPSSDMGKRQFPRAIHIAPGPQNNTTNLTFSKLQAAEARPAAPSRPGR
jgi:TPR repeat protein